MKVLVDLVPGEGAHHNSPFMGSSHGRKCWENCLGLL